MPRSLAEGRKRVVIMTTAPAILEAPTKAELDAGIFASCRIMEGDFKLGATGSDTVDEKTLCDKGSSETFSGAKFEGAITPFRYYDATGKPEPTTPGTPGAVGDAVFQTLKEKNTEIWIAVRETGKDADEPFVAGDEVSVFHAETDNWQFGEGTGYIKRMVPLSVKGDSELNAVVGPVTP